MPPAPVAVVVEAAPVKVKEEKSQAADEPNEPAESTVKVPPVILMSPAPVTSPPFTVIALVPAKVPAVIKRSPAAVASTPAVKVPVPLIVRLLYALAPVIATEESAVTPDPEVYVMVEVPAVNVPVAVKGVPEPEIVTTEPLARNVLPELMTRVSVVKAWLEPVVESVVVAGPAPAPCAVVAPVTEVVPPRFTVSARPDEDEGFELRAPVKVKAPAIVYVRATVIVGDKVTL